MTTTRRLAALLAAAAMLLPPAPASAAKIDEAGGWQVWSHAGDNPVDGTEGNDVIFSDPAAGQGVGKVAVPQQ